ncbi:hypothetical protein X975_16165, partial [Stegodyphus mimosarum]
MYVKIINPDKQAENDILQLLKSYSRVTQYRSQKTDFWLSETYLYDFVRSSVICDKNQ